MRIFEGPTGGNVAIKTPVGTLGVRGTTVWGGFIDGAIESGLREARRVAAELMT